MSDLIKFLKANPQGFKAYRGEKNLNENSDYIFLDVTNLINVGFDNGGIQKAEIVINIYSQDFTKGYQVMKYLQTRLNGNVKCRHDIDYQVFTFVRTLFIELDK